MELEINPNVSVLDQARLQAQALLPVLEALRAEMGKERADRLVLGALRAWLREGYQSLGARFPGSPEKKFDALWAMGVSRIQENDAVTFAFTESGVRTRTEVLSEKASGKARSLLPEEARGVGSCLPHLSQ